MIETRKLKKLMFLDSKSSNLIFFMNTPKVTLLHKMNCVYIGFFVSYNFEIL